MQSVPQPLPMAAPMVAPPSPAEIPDGFMADSSGRLVPIANVREEHKLEDELVRQLHSRAVALSEALRQFRENGFAEIAALMEMLAERYQAPKGGAKGNMTLSSYDGSLRVQVAIGDYLTFGPELQIAKRLVDACLVRWSQGANDNLRTIINDAFAVDKEGKLKVDRILGLRRLEIVDPEWKSAMEAIGDAVRVTHSKQYLRLYRRAADGAYAQVPLDVARV
jgi:hypothetical protein